MDKSAFAFNVIKNYLYETKFRVEGTPVEAGAKPPVLQFRVSRNNPKFIVYLNSPSYTKDFGKVELAVSTFEFFEITTALKSIIENKDADTITIKFSDFKWYGKQRSKEKEFTGSVTIGRDNGCVFMGFNFGDGIDKPKFVFGGRTDTNYYNNTKKRNLTDVEISEVKARGMVNAIEMVISQVLVREYVEPKPKENKQGNNNRGSNNYSRDQNDNQSQQNNTQRTDYEDEIPWG